MQRSVAPDWCLHSSSCWIFSVWRSADSWIDAPSAFTHSAGYARRSGTFNVLFNYCIHSRGEYNKDIGPMPLLLCGGIILCGGLSMTEVYTKCTALRRRTLARCKEPFHFGHSLDVKFRSLGFIQSRGPEVFVRLMVSVSKFSNNSI